MKKTKNPKNNSSYEVHEKYLTITSYGKIIIKGGQIYKLTLE